ncbi:hypothetical protein F5Y15DRAFT_428913 [Xylariaceae sp. FL0016]|nr:hypothetical protein F5Y15DRAFT_428913 [Xylariaceae sp. FL0016]
MDDQFNGRTDDDLFADDFEPVADPVSAPVVGAQPDPIPQTASHHVAEPVAEVSKPIPPKSTSSAPKSLSQSRHAPKPAQAHQPRQRKPSPKRTASTAASTTTESTSALNSEPSSSNAPEPTPPTAPAAASQPPPSKPATGPNTALADRLSSGANPRTKLSDTELAAKMEKMRLLNIEKTRKFEQAEQDSRSHALAYEKGMEEARKRRAEDAERRRRGDEERKRMDEERAANRERKLKAMGAKEGGWDEGKGAFEDDRERRGFRGANGGVRGTRSGMGMAGSRFAEGNEADAPREFAADEFRGRGRGPRGRGSSRGGRGGRGGHAEGDRGTRGDSKRAEQAPPKAEDFPALPGGQKLDTSNAIPESAKHISLSPGPNSPPIGKWDDEMAALDAKTGA